MNNRLKSLALAGGIVAGVLIAVPGISQAADCGIDDYLVQTDASQTSGDVECLQTALNEQGYDSGPVDGWFGPITEGAVTRYQQANSLTVDGQVGSETAGSLGVWGSSSSSDTSSSSSDTSYDEPDQSGGSDTAGVYEPWISLANCESGGNWSINTGNGYYGGLQFALGSWQAVGGSGLPSDASPSEQVYRGELLQDQQGWGAWPTCARIIGLL